MSGFLSSLGLSSYLHGHGQAAEQSGEVAPDVPQDEAQPATPPAASPALDSPAEQPPYTPDHRPTSRFSPNSLSTSNATMSGVLTAHPHFSVFRKSASATSLDELAVTTRGASASPEGARAEAAARADFSMRDLLDDEVETLATPPNQSPAARKASPKGDRSGSSEASSFHLSLDSAEMHSLNFGDQSSLSLSPAASPSAAAPGPATRTPTTASPAQTSGVRLVPDSPPTTRTPVPRSRSTSAQSTGKMRSSVGPVQRVQFSPISSCPSPLLSASTLPPPPPPPPAFADPSTSSALRASSSTSAARADRWAPLDGTSYAADADAQSRAGSGILKYPRTPGTGRSVRFTASVVERTPEPEAEGEGDGPVSEDSPSVAVGERSAGRAARAYDGREEEADDRPDESAASTHDASGAEPGADGDSSVLVASFLSKLQAAIPSPDVSLAGSATSLPSPPPLAPAPAPVADLPLISVDPSTSGPAPAPTLFDESNPYTGLNSALGASVLERPDVSAASSSAPLQRPLDVSASLLVGGDSSSSRTMSASGTFLLQGSLAGGAHPGAPSFGGQSFADLSALQPRSLLIPRAQAQQLGALSEDAETSRLVEVAGSRANLRSSTALGTATPRAASTLSAPLSSAPAVPSPLRFEAPHDLSMASSAADESHEAGQAVGPAHDTSLRLIDFSSPPPPASPLRPAAAPSSPLRTSRASPPPQPSTPSSPAAAAPPAPAPTPATSLAGSSSSFYRQFMAARARDGLSQSARDEWSRLERGEKASPKEGARVEDGVEDEEREEDDAAWEEREEQDGREAGDRTEASVYYSPQREWHDEHEAAAAATYVASSLPVGVEEDDEAVLAESSIVELEEARAAFLSPIVEVTEPESNANTPFELAGSTSRARARAPPPAQPSFAASLSSSLAAVSSSSTHVIPTPATPSRAQPRRAPATPQSASRIPRPRNPITPSQNPFLLQLARTSSSSIQPQAVTLLQDLFSTQQDQLAASSSQRFLLSSLVTNLQNEVEHKDAVIRTLKEQVGETRSELKEVEQLALAWEERALRTGPSGAAAPPLPASARKTSAALEETVQLLADELETRVREDRALRDDLEAELARTRAELARKAHDVRDGEIRLRHAHAALEHADDERAAMKREVEQCEERRAEVVRERDELRSRWAVDVEQREQALARLRDEVHELRALGESGRGLDAEAVEREVQRRVDAAQAEAQREAQLVRHELVQRDAALADLRDQLRAQRDESDRLGRAVQEERQHAELAHADMADTLAAKENELDEVLRDHDALQQDLDEACVRIEAAELERDRLAEAARAKDGELAEQVAQCQTALAAMADLEAAVVRIEAEAAAKDAQLAQVHKELASARRESADVLEKRDRVLAESEKQAGRTRKELEALQKETNRLNDLVSKLRRDSADREVKVTKLKKRTAELEEDVFGLNIALDAKQQEAQHWKRQMSTIKLERESAAATAAAAAAESSYASRSTLAPHVPSSAAPSTAKAYRRTSTSTRLHSTTPFPAEKQARRTSSSLSRRTSTTSASTSRRSSAVDPAISTDDEEHDLTLPPTAYEQTPSRPAVSTAGVRKSASTAHLSLGLGLPAASRSRRTSAPQDREKENDAPAPVRRREAMLA